MKIGKFSLINADKVERAINGTILDQGRLTGGVGADADDGAIIAEYDRLGGLIRMGMHKVKTGGFFDFKNKKPHDKPKPMLEFRVDGELVEVDATKPLPIEVQAAEIALTKKQKKAEAARQAAADKAGKKAAAKKAKNKGKGVADDEESDEEDTKKDSEDGDGDLA